MGRPSRFSPEVRERAVRMVEEHREAHASAWAVLQSVAPKLGCTAETRRTWVRQAQRDAGHRPGLTTRERERLKELEREVRELKRANEILRKAFAYVAQAELDRRRTSPRWSSSSPTIAPCSGSSRSARAADRPVDGLIAIGTSGHIRRAGPHGRRAPISSASRFSGSLTRTSRSTAPGTSGSRCGGTASAWRAAPWRA